jgi:hypothetical protein
MVLHAIALVASLSQAAQPYGGGLPQSPIAEIVVKPARLTVVAGDTLRIVAEALDAQGRKVGNAQIRYFVTGGFFEGVVEPDGLVRSGSTGKIPVNIVATVPGTQPAIRQVEVWMVPGPAARVEIEPGVRRLLVGQRVLLKAQSYSAAGDARNDAVGWSSSMSAVAAVAAGGLLTATAPGRTVITARAGEALGTLPIEVVAGNISKMEISPARVQARAGDVIRFDVTAKTGSGAAVTGFTPSWSFSPGQGLIEHDGAFVAYEPGDYIVTALLGERSASAVVTVSPRDVTRAITVVGRLPRTLFNTEEVWVHPNGRHAYLGTGGGGDRLYAIDIGDPSRPVVTDSLVVDTRRVNDVMTTPDGRTLVFTREGASDRRNGIVLASLEDPARPKVIAEFTDGVTAGVHSAFIYQQEKYGTHVYLTNDGTGALHIVDIGDPHHPREVAQWRTARPDAGRSLHDVDVQDGLAYLSYWNDNLVILDVGNGIKGGSPSDPRFVSQFRYDLDALYRHVEIAGGPGFIRGTHTAWRHRDYVFIADEVFPASQVKGAKDAAAGGAYGRLQVVDVSDIEKPRAVAWFEPEVGGVHNIWVAGDTLYMGAYNGGLHVYDISGELRGDLRAQGRRIAHLNTADMSGRVQNTAMTWGVVVKNGLMYVNDMYNGLWIVRLEPRKRPIS